VDWSFDFKSLDGGEGRGGINPEHSARTKDWLKEIEADPQKYMATTDGGWPKIGWKRVIQVGMYDGWPFWKPIPSFQLAGPLGAEWHPWYSLSGFEKMRPVVHDTAGRVLLEENTTKYFCDTTGLTHD
jgi:hypothetical protein